MFNESKESIVVRPDYINGGLGRNDSIYYSRSKDPSVEYPISINGHRLHIEHKFYQKDNGSWSVDSILYECGICGKELSFDATPANSDIVKKYILGFFFTESCV